MPRLDEIAQKVRSKNAGPFWLTIDIFCGTDAAYETLVQSLSTDRIAALYQQPVEVLKRFDIPDLKVIKISMPRPVVQGSRADRDMHASQWGWLLAELEIN